MYIFAAVNLSSASFSSENIDTSTLQKPIVKKSEPDGARLCIFDTVSRPYPDDDLRERAINSRSMLPSFLSFSPNTATHKETRAREFCQWDRGRCKVHRESLLRPASLFLSLFLSPSLSPRVSCVLLGTWQRRTHTAGANTIGRRARARTCHASFSSGLCRAARFSGIRTRVDGKKVPHMQSASRGRELRSGGNVHDPAAGILFVIKEVKGGRALLFSFRENARRAHDEASGFN